MKSYHIMKKNWPLSCSKNPGHMHNLSCENEFYLDDNEKSFPYQRLSAYPRFDTEAPGNSEMASSLL